MGVRIEEAEDGDLQGVFDTPQEHASRQVCLTLALPSLDRERKSSEEKERREGGLFGGERGRVGWTFQGRKHASRVLVQVQVHTSN